MAAAHVPALAPPLRRGGAGRGACLLLARPRGGGVDRFAGSGLRVVSCGPERREAALELLRQAFAEPFTAAELEWWLDRNPFGPGILSLADDGGRVVGVAGMTFSRFRVHGEERTVAVSVYAATAPAYRGRGIFTALELHNEALAVEAGAPLAVAYDPSPDSLPVFLGPLGWRAFARRRIWARILRRGALPAYLLGRPLPGGGLPPPASVVTVERGLRVEPLRAFDGRADRLWARVAPSLGNAAVRNARYLAWRYLDSPRPYRTLACFREAALEGIAVYGYAERRGIPAATLTELIVPEGEGRVASALLDRCLRELRSGPSVLIALPPPGLRGAFLRAGFVPTNRTLLFCVKPLGEGFALGRPETWSFSLGDLDFL